MESSSSPVQSDSEREPSQVSPASPSQSVAPTSPRARSRSLRRVGASAGGVLLVALLTIGYLRRHAPVFIDDVAFAGLSPSETKTVLARWFADQSGRSLSVRVREGVCSLVPREYGATLDEPTTIRRLDEARRRRGGDVVHVVPQVNFDPDKLASWIERCELDAGVNLPVAGSITWGKADFVMVESKAGARILRSQVPAVLSAALASSHADLPALSLASEPANPPPEQLQQALKSMTELVRHSVVIRAVSLQRTTRLSRDDLGRSVRISPGADGRITVAFHGDALRETLGNRARRLAQEPREATLEVNDEGRLSLVPEAEGLAIDWETLALRLTEAVREGRREVEIPHRPSGSPKRHVAEVEALGISERLASFATRHACCQPRVTNIHRIAELVNSTIVMPGEVFSLNEHVGQRTIANGFVSAPGIEDGDMRDSVGGGVSQFTTTFYNAVLRAGLEIIERQAHSYWFERYPMGHEATLSWPKPDFIWKNDSPTAVLVTCSFTERSITVALWGKSDGRRVVFGASSPTEAVPPPVEMLPNPEIDPEKEKTKDGGRMGFSVMTTRTVTLPDKTTRTDHRKVTYRPQVRRVEVHPCRIKEGEPGYTGERCPISDAGAPEAPAEELP